MKQHRAAAVPTTGLGGTEALQQGQVEGGGRSNAEVAAEVGGTQDRPKILGRFVQDVSAELGMGEGLLGYDIAENEGTLEADLDVTYADLSDQQLFVRGPTADDVVQSNLADCWLMGTLTALASTSPDYIEQELIRPRGAGVYDVALYWPEDVLVTADGRMEGHWTQPKRHVITVTAALPVATTDRVGNPAPSTTPFYGHSHDADELWPALVEKAAAILMEQVGFEGSSHEGSDGMEGGYGLLDWGSAERALYMLTGSAPLMVSREDDVTTLSRDRLASDGVEKATRTRPVEVRSGGEVTEHTSGAVQLGRNAPATKEVDSEQEWAQLVRSWQSGAVMTARTHNHVLGITDLEPDSRLITTEDPLGSVGSRAETWSFQEFRAHFVGGWCAGQLPDEWRTRR
jgi:hypothetical protein